MGCCCSRTRGDDLEREPLIHDPESGEEERQTQASKDAFKNLPKNAFCIMLYPLHGRLVMNDESEGDEESGEPERHEGSDFHWALYHHHDLSSFPSIQYSTHASSLPYSFHSPTPSRLDHSSGSSSSPFHFVDDASAANSTDAVSGGFKYQIINDPSFSSESTSGSDLPSRLKPKFWRPSHEPVSDIFSHPRTPFLSLARSDSQSLPSVMIQSGLIPEDRSRIAQRVITALDNHLEAIPGINDRVWALTIVGMLNGKGALRSKLRGGVGGEGGGDDGVRSEELEDLEGLQEECIDIAKGSMR